MFVALDEKEKTVNLLNGIPVRKTYRCPTCHGTVRLKNGRVMRPHFAHVNLQDCPHSWENESRQHLELKAQLYRWLSQDEAVAIEKVLPELQQVADLLVNDQLSLEVQCSSLSIHRLRERTSAYREAGYQVLWLLGKDLWLKESLTALQRQFLSFSQNMGFHLWELDLAQSVLRLRYLIHEDWHGKVQCLTKTFPFGQGSLLAILRIPYLQQAMASFPAKMDQHLCRYIAKQLHYQSPKWVALQGQAYEQGENLLTKTVDDFYPQVRLPVSEEGFSQIQQDLAPVYQAFFAYYSRVADKRQQVLYPPIAHLRHLKC